jgi:hypothetical protein
MSTDSAALVKRNSKGQWTSGNKSGGRKVGSSVKLTAKFVDDFVADYSRNGKRAIERVRLDHPVQYLQIGLKLIERQDKSAATIQLTQTNNFFADARDFGAAYKKALEFIGSEHTIDITPDNEEESI